MAAEEKYTRYSEIVYHLMAELEIPAPELWVRRENQHTLTESGRRWTWVQGPDLIERGSGLILDYIEAVGLRDYVVVLVHEDSKDIPVPLGECIGSLQTNSFT